MKKIHVYIVTYKNNPILKDWGLKHLFEANEGDAEVKVAVIGNHSEDEIPDEYQDKVEFLPNNLRPDFSNGHLARNWNQAIVNGFENLNDPACDIVVCMQNDTIVEKDWVNVLLKLHEKYDFYSCGHGDQFHSYTAAGVKTAGLWDERFCGIGYQERDYFKRVNLLLGEKASINDFDDPTYPVTEATVITTTSSGWMRQEESCTSSCLIVHPITLALLNAKWAGQLCHLPQFISYPYFEKDISDRKQKFYYN